MAAFQRMRFSPRQILVSSSALIALTLPFCGAALAQSSPSAPSSSDPSTLNELRPLNQADNPFSIPGGQRLIDDAGQAIANQDYTTAADKLKDARDLLNQLSIYYRDLSNMFLGLDNRLYESNRTRALDATQKRDEASYRLALVYRAMNRPELAVPLLMEILQSQQPTRELGQQAYQQLFELGFVEMPFPSSNRASSSSVQ